VNPDKEPDKPIEATPADLDQTRREAMLRMAKYTAPVMLGMLVSEKAMAASTPPSPPPYWTRDDT
jgi:hypothetical protein